VTKCEGCSADIPEGRVRVVHGVAIPIRYCQSCLSRKKAEFDAYPKGYPKRNEGRKKK
jgi:hypothetical protein